MIFDTNRMMDVISRLLWIRQIEVYEDERYLHLITELCTGGELFDRIIAKTQSSEGHFSEHDAAKLVWDILDAIRYCHSMGIVHRDLKPENFLFMTPADDAPIKIIDFGLSRFVYAIFVS
jgi:calcium-dependent protein kinase